ncbi:MAG: choice-of-anchor J domain-containing protein, partial [Bacteroidales bacterium]|nr:choice-of-anchor J domain-containing protein [Bacteroidales bacterium]
FELYDSTFDHDMVASAIDNNGNAMAATPSGTPIREWSIRSGAYWFPFNQIVKQQYGYDFYAKTLFENTGTPLFLSDDNKRAAVMVDPYSAYVVTFPTTFSEACVGVDLLGSYTVYPKEGATISRLKEITLNFDHDIQIIGSKTCVEIRNKAGETVYNSIGLTANGKKATVTYRSGALTAGESYTLHIPAGAIALAMDKNMSNKEINIAYNGRENAPVKLTTIYPAEESAIAKIDNSTNPIVLTFDVPVYLPDSAIAYLYNENDIEPVATMLMAYNNNVVAVYPTTTQYLFKDNNYRVEVMPGSVTDVAGNGANEKIVIKYRGSYEREVVYDDNSLLIENFNTVGVANCLPWDADRLQPSATAQAIGFDRHDYGWAIVWDENDTNIAASSHSMYNPAGKSNDWLIMPQLYIPDEKCALTFLSQSFLTGYQDYLKVYIWANEEVINMPSDELVARFAKEADLVYNDLQSPGSDDNTLAGDWTENHLSLAQYAGKNIYIAFVNDNENQSAVFIDDVMVSHNKPFRVAFTNETSVIGLESILISGVLSIDSDTDVYQSISLSLSDNNGNEIETISEDGLNLKKGDVYKFAFTKELPLETGLVNKFKLTVVCNENTYEIDGKITNLAFNPVKRVVLEEISGMGCANCPLGFISIEKIHEMYGDLFIPICIRTFQDPLGAGLTPYTNYLGLASAPSAVINRKSISFPAISYDGEYYFSNTQLPVASDKLWLDIVAEELEIPTEADIKIGQMSVDPNTNESVIPCTIKYALSADNLNLSLFTVVMEDYVSSMQKNGFASITSENLGEWGKGGIYGQSLIMDYKLMDVCRSYEGLTFNGTSGYFPQEIVAGQEYTAEIRTQVPATLEKFAHCKIAVMLIDANTGAYINAALSNDFSGVAHINNNANATVTTENGKIVVTTADDARVEAYGANGMLIGTAYGNGQIAIDAPAGVAIVRVTTGDNVTVATVLVK